MKTRTFTNADWWVFIGGRLSTMFVLQAQNGTPGLVVYQKEKIRVDSLYRGGLSSPPDVSGRENSLLFTPVVDTPGIV